MRSISSSSRNKNNGNTTSTTGGGGGKSSSRLVHSIASGLKKGTKIFKKGSSSSRAAGRSGSFSLGNNNTGKKREFISRGRRAMTTASEQGRDGAQGGSSGGNDNYGSFRSGGRRRRRRRKHQWRKNDDAGQFSSPERKSLLDSNMNIIQLQPLSSDSVQRKNHSINDVHMSARSRDRRHSHGHGVGLGLPLDLDDSIQAKVLRNFEYVVRHSLIYVAIYLYGAYQPFSLLSNETVLHVGHYLLIVWGTAFVLRALVYYATLNENQNENDKGSNDSIVEQLMFSDEEGGRQLPVEDDTIDDTEGEPVVESPIREHEQEEEDEHEYSHGHGHGQEEEHDDLDHDLQKRGAAIFSSPSPYEKGKNLISPEKQQGTDDSLHSVASEHDISEQSWSQVDKVIGSDRPQEHPELEDLFLIDKVANERVYPNGEPIPFDNELFSGHSLLMFRTSDADAKEPPESSGGSEKNDAVSNYLRHKKRRFEIQMQFKFKKLPDSPLFMCCDLDHPIKLGLVQRAFVKATLNFVLQKNPTLSYCLTGYDKVSEEDRKAGKYENPHIAFPVETTLDRLVVTKPGEQPPQLGGDVYEDPDAMATRKKGITYNMSDTYTFCIWSAYIDFLSWKAVNLPAIRPFSIANVNGAQPTSLKFYSLKSTSGKHFCRDMDTVFDIELSNRQITSLGNGTKKWIEKRIQDRATDPMTKDVKENGLSVVVESYNNLDSYNIDVDDDILSSEIEVDEGSQAPSDSDLDMLDEIDDRILGDDAAMTQNDNGLQNKEMMMHLQLYPYYDGKLNQSPQHVAGKHFSHSEVKNFNIDTLSWVEMMHRKRKKPQRVYVVRMVRQAKQQDFSNQESHADDEINEPKSFFRLRTGKQLSTLLRLGLELGVQMLNGEDPKSVDDDFISEIKVKPVKRRAKSHGDHHVAVNKALKQTIKRRSPSSRKSKLESLKKSSYSIAGQMTPPDQSCLTLSHIFADLSKASKSMEKVSQSISSQISPLYTLDSWFLRGTISELGIVPIVSTKTENIHGEFVVARCLWESHFREEGCIIYDNRIEFYAPSAKKPSCTTSFCDVQEIRRIDTPDEKDPLVGLPKLVIETHWKCHYLVFIDNDTRTNFNNILNSTIFSSSLDMKQKDEWQAHFWQGFQPMNSLSGKWAKIVSSKKKSHHRLVLNNRRMGFDTKGFTGSIDTIREIGEFVEDLLRTALCFSLESFETSPDEFVNFQDKTSRLKNLPINKLVRSGQNAFCICINLYHCLLQHSLLLSPSTPTKKSIVTFMRTHCYEIGGDVFSLAELECCVIRGHMDQGHHPKPPFVREPKKSRAHYLYALDTVDPRINFILNTGDTSKPRQVPILTTDTLEEQLTSISTRFLRANSSVDVSKRTVTLPKICEVYKNDFGSDFPSIYNYFLQFMDEENQNTWIEMINSETHGNSSISFKFHHSPDRFYSILKLLE